MKNTPQRTGFFIKLHFGSGIVGQDCLMGMDSCPQAAQETLRPRDSIIVPLKRLIRRGGKHGEKTHGISAVTVNQTLRVNAVIF